MADQVTIACEKEFPRHSADCSGFVRAVCADLGVAVTGLANDIVNTIRAGGAWTRLADGGGAAGPSGRGDRGAYLGA